MIIKILLTVVDGSVDIDVFVVAAVVRFVPPSVVRWGGRQGLFLVGVGAEQAALSPAKETRS